MKKRAEKLELRKLGRVWHLKKIKFAMAFLSELEADVKNTYPEKKLVTNIEKLPTAFERIQNRLESGIF